MNNKKHDVLIAHRNRKNAKQYIPSQPFYFTYRPIYSKSISLN